MSTGELILTPPNQLLSRKRRASTPRRTPRFAGTIAGHLWTCVPSMFIAARSLTGPPAKDFHATVADPVMGKVRLTGLFTDVYESDTLVLIVHGLAGSARSPYCALAAKRHNKPDSVLSDYPCVELTSPAKTYFMAG